MDRFSDFQHQYQFFVLSGHSESSTAKYNFPPVFHVIAVENTLSKIDSFNYDHVALELYFHFKNFQKL